MRAPDLKPQGGKPREIAAAFDVTKGAVGRWLTAAHLGGREALLTRPGRGTKRKLAPEQIRLIPDFLWHGAEADGFRGEVWTCDRVAGVIREEFGVSYGKSRVWRPLKGLGWTPQVPITRAIRRDEAAIKRWRVESWPVLKERARRERRKLVFADESGSSLLPGVVRTSGPKARTPVLDEWQTHDHLSIMAGVTPRGQVDSLVRPKSLNGMHSIEFLVPLGRLAGDRLLVIWDGSPIHRRAEVKDFVAEAGEALRLGPPPASAPDLNPVEWLWRHLKEVEMRNLTCLDLDQLHLELDLALGRVRQKPRLFRSFFEGAGLEA
jgi:transposase